MSPLYVLTYHPQADGPGRMVEVRLEAMATPGPAYRLAHLQPSNQVRDWAAQGARFGLSVVGAIRVWLGGRLVAGEDPRDGAPPLSSDDCAYLGAYLAWQRATWQEGGAMPGPDGAPGAAPDGARPRLRILHTEAATSFGGQEYCIYKEMLAMRERGHHLEAVCQPRAELGVRLQQAGFRVHTMPMDGTANFWSAIATIRRQLRRTPFDVVHTHSRRDTVLGAIAARLAGTPLIVRTRHLAKPIHSLYAYTWLAHGVIAVSDFVRRQLLDGGASPDRIAMIHSPVEPLSADDGSRVRRELGLAADTPVIGCVAAMRADKGLADLLDAFKRISARHSRAHLVVAGDGEPLLSLLRERAVALNLAGRVHFLGRRDDVGDVMRAFDVFALPTRSEALGTVFIEAAALGLPVIGGDVGGVPETLLPGVSGLLVPPGEVVPLARALDELLSDAPRRLAMGRMGRAYVESGRFSPAVTASQVEYVYLRWLATRGWRAGGGR